MPPFTFEEAIGESLPERIEEESLEPEIQESSQDQLDTGDSAPEVKQTEPFSFEDASLPPDRSDISFTTLFNDLRKIDPSIDALLGAGEVALQMQTAFAGALPALDEGITKAIEDGDVQSFAKRFKDVQNFFTFEPRTEKGKQFSENVGEIFEKFSSFIDEKLVEPNLKPGQENPLLATIGKTAGEGLLLLAPLKGVGGKGKAPSKPVVKPTEPTPVDATLDFEIKPTESTVPGPKTIEVAAEPSKPVTAGEIDPALQPEILPKPTERLGPPTREEIQALKPGIKEVIEQSASPEEAAIKATEPSTIIDVSDPAFKPKPIATDPLLQDPAIRVREEGRRVEQVEPFTFEEATKEALPETIPEEPAVIIREQTPAQKKAREKITSLDTQTDSMLPAIAKLGGLDKGEVVKQFGLDPKDNIPSGIFGKPVLRKSGGKSIDGMMEALSEETYLKRDEVTGKPDPREFEEKFFEEDAGNKQFSSSQDIEARFDFNSEYENYVNSESYSLNVGIPVEEIAAGIKKANENLRDAVGKPEKGVHVVQRQIAKQPGLLNPFRSPRMVAKKFPEFAPVKKLADRAIVEQDTLRSVFNKRLNHVNELLKKGETPFKSNKRLLDNILLQGDTLGKNFTRKELEASDVPPNVINAYNAVRSAYDRAFGIANKTRELRNKLPINKRTGYIPHFFHDWMIAVDGELVASARTMREAVSMGNDAARGGGRVKIFPKQFEFPNADTQAAVVGDLDFFKVQKNLEDTFSMSPKEAGDLLTNFARMKGRSRFVGNFLERKGAKGWEQDLAYVNRHYFNMISRFSALDKFKSKAISQFERNYGDFAKDHSGIAEFTKDYINDINGVPTGIENLINSTLANTPAFSKFLGKSLGDRPALQLASTTTNAVAIAKLGLFNVSSAMVNASQLMMSNALLGPKWTANGLRRATKIAIEKGRRKLGGLKKANPDIGILKKLGIGLQQGLESGAGYSKFNQMGQLFNKSTALFQGAEWQLRSATGLGAYHKGLAEGMTKTEALAFAKETNTKANFDYSIADSPEFLRQSGPPGQVLFQFKKFPIKALEFMTELKGAENPRFWIPFVLVSGLYGLPGMEAVKNMANRLTGKDIELTSKEFLIRWAGDDPAKLATAKSIMFGAFSNDALGAVDLSRRIGAGDFIPSSGRDLLGPFFSSAISASQLAGRGEWVDALRSITTAPGNIAVALRNDGEITSPWDRGRLTTKLDKKSRILKGLGFTTTKESVERTVSRILTKNAREAKEDEKKAIDQFIKVMDSGDKEKIDKAVTRIAELGVTSQRIKNEFQKKGQTKAFRTFLNLSRKRQAADVDILKFLGQPGE